MRPNPNPHHHPPQRFPISVAKLWGGEAEADSPAGKKFLISSLLNRLRPILCDLDRRCKPSGAPWPTETVLTELDGLVKDLCGAFDRKRVRVDWSDYKFLNERRPSLKLCARVKTLFHQFGEQTPPRPANPMIELAREQTKRGRQAAKLMKLWSKLITGETPRGAVEWSKDFDLLFRTPSTGASPTGLELDGEVPSLKGLHESHPAFCYVSYLDLYWRDKRWLNIYSDGAFRLLHWAERLFPPDDPVSQMFAGIFPGPRALDEIEDPAIRARTLARERKRRERERAKISAQKA